MRGALSAQVDMQASQLLPAVDDRHRHRDLRGRGRANPMRSRSSATAATWREQLAGIERLPGTYPFTLERSVQRVSASTTTCTGWSSPRTARRSSRDPEASFEAAGLTEEERDLIRRRDWRGLIHYGVDLLHAREAGRGDGRVEPAHLRAHARPDAGRVPETRNTKALYSVAGKDAANIAWDKPWKTRMSERAVGPCRRWRRRHVLADLSRDYVRKTGQGASRSRPWAESMPRHVRAGEKRLRRASPPMPSRSSKPRVSWFPEPGRMSRAPGIAVAVAAARRRPTSRAKARFADAVMKAKPSGSRPAPAARTSRASEVGHRRVGENATEDRHRPAFPWAPFPVRGEADSGLPAARADPPRRHHAPRSAARGNPGDHDIQRRRVRDVRACAGNTRPACLPHITRDRGVQAAPRHEPMTPSIARIIAAGCALLLLIAVAQPPSFPSRPITPIGCPYSRRDPRYRRAHDRARDVRSSSASP